MKWTLRLIVPLSTLVLLLTAFENCNSTSFQGSSSTAASSSSSGSSSSGGSSGNTSQSTVLPAQLAGKYTVSQWSCGTLDISGALSTFTTLPSISVSASAATIAIPLLPGCSANESLALSYDSSGDVNVSVGATSCSSSCYSFECEAIAAPQPALQMSYQFTNNGSIATLTHTLTSADLGATQSLFAKVGCGVGQQLVMILDQQ